MKEKRRGEGGWDGTQDQIEANREYGDTKLADLFEFYTEHLEDWEAGNSEYEHHSFREEPVYVLKHALGEIVYGFRMFLATLKAGVTKMKLGDDYQPHFHNLKGMRLRQAVMFGTIWEQEVPAQESRAIEVVRAIRDDPDIEFTPETVLESLEGLREEQE